MKNLVFIFIITASTGIYAKGNFSVEFLPLWERATEYTLKVVEAMPENNYSYKATDEVNSFAKLTGHIAGNLYWLNSKFIREEENPMGDIDWENLSKSKLIENMKSAFEYVAESVNNINDEDLKAPVKFGGENVNQERIFYLMRDHMTHHRAQLILYLRLNNIEPPRYVGW